MRKTTHNIEEIYKKGIEALKNHNTEESIDFFNELLEKDPTNVKAWLCLAEIYGGIYRDYDEAIEAIQNLNNIKSGGQDNYSYFIHHIEHAEVLMNDLRTTFEELVGDGDWYPVTILFFLNKPFEKQIEMYNYYLEKLKVNEGLNEDKISIVWFNFMVAYYMNGELENAIDAGEKCK